MSERSYRQQMLDRATVELTGASRAGILQVMFEMFHEFFDVSSAWQEDIPFQTVAGQQNYVVVPLATPPGQIIRLAGVVDPDTVNQAAIMPDIGTISLKDIPNTGGVTFTATVIKDVILPCKVGDIVDVPEDTVKRWFPGLLSGVLGKMMLQPGKSYTSDQGSVYHLKKFEAVKTSARVATLRRNTYGTNSWAYPQQFRTSGQRGGVAVGTDQSFGGTP